jgi:hypothetical protein
MYPSLSWDEMYKLYLRNFQMMNEYYMGYLENMKKLMETSSEESRKMNEESGDQFAKSSQNVTNLYASYIQLYQKWIDVFWHPYFMGVEARQGSSMR